MKEQIHEQLSALMDGELERDRMRFLLKRLAGDSSLAPRWTRYHVARLSLRRQHFAPFAGGFADAVMARLELEPAHARGAQGWLRWGAGGAIAASVAVAALVLAPRPAVEPAALPAGAAFARGGAAPAATANAAMVAAPVAPANEFRPPLLAPNAPVETAPASFGTDLVEPVAVDARMQSYLIRHYEAAGPAGQSNFVPYVLLGVP